MEKGTPTSQRRLLIAALIFGGAALGCALFTIWAEDDFAASYFVLALFEAAGVLGLNQPAEPPTHAAFAWARLFALLFALLGALGVLAEISGTVSNGLLRLRFLWLRVVWRKKPAVVIGLGWVGGPLARDLRAMNRPVYGTTLEEDSPRAIAARRGGVLVVVGDVTDPVVRHRLRLRHATEVFIATGDDVQNMNIAGALYHDARQGALDTSVLQKPMDIYTHITDKALEDAFPLLTGKLVNDDGRAAHKRTVHLHTFNTTERAALQLFYDRDIGIARSSATVPSVGEVFHLFIFGFGPIGQAVALQAARSAHFANLLRPRVTVFDDGPVDARARFLERHPALAPHNLDLTAAAFLDLKEADAWSARPARPRDERYHSDPWVGVNKQKKQVCTDDELTDRIRVRPLEYAINLEFLPCPSLTCSNAVYQAVLERLNPPKGLPVRAAAVFCFEEEQKCATAALELRRAFAEHAGAENPRPASAPEKKAVLPIYVHLPTESGITSMLEQPVAIDPEDSEAAIREQFEQHFPLRIFPKRQALYTQYRTCAPDQDQPEETPYYDYESVVQRRVRSRARLIDQSHHQIAGAARSDHPDFAASNDAASRFTTVRFDALGICFSADLLKEEQAEVAGVYPKPILAALMTDEVLRTQRELERRARRDGKEKIEMSLDAFNELSQPLRERLALLDRIQPPSNIPNQDDLQPLHDALHACVDAAMTRFAKDLGGDQQAERAASKVERVAAMEHNRWMGERLAVGWRFGSRSAFRRQRITFVPWEDLDPLERRYDLIHLPRLILEWGPRWSDARPGTIEKQRSLRFAYARRTPAGMRHTDTP